MMKVLGLGSLRGSAVVTCFFTLGANFSAYSDETSIPNTFSAGEVIDAQEFNENFSALQTAIDSIPAGPQGPRGPQGPQGPVGAEGPGVPVGTLLMSAAASAPEGYLLADGSSVSRVQYDALFAAIGITYGSGDGSTTFDLPNLRGRFPLGVSPFDVLGDTGGADQVGLTVDNMPSHTHPVTDPGHQHTYGMGRDDGDVSSQPGQVPPGDSFTSEYTLATQPSTTGVTVGARGSGDPVNIRNPYIAVNFIIRY